jgi:hypothetical protein
MMEEEFPSIQRIVLFFLSANLAASPNVQINPKVF